MCTPGAITSTCRVSGAALGEGGTGVVADVVRAVGVVGADGDHERVDRPGPPARVRLVPSLPLETTTTMPARQAFSTA